MERSLLYVSRRQATEADIRDIVETARVRNARLQVTGALIATDTHFAQVLEGSRAAINELMDSILRDRRHEQIDVVQDRQADQRGFPTWSMAYSGRSVFAESLIGALATRGSEEPEGRHLRRLQDFMREFARTSP
jgi:hypothetical protein